MWIVFAGTLAVAALVSQRRLEGRQMQMGGPERYESLSFRFPQDWQKSPAPNVIARAVEPSGIGRAAARVISVRLVKLQRNMSTEEFLVRSGLPTTLERATFDDLAAGQTKPRQIMMGGHPGMLTGGMTITQKNTTEGIVDLPVRAYFAATVLPTRVGILVTLESQGPRQVDDVDILTQVATSMELTDRQAAPQPTVVGSILLPDGLRVTVPDGYVPIPETDPNRTIRTLRSQSATAATLIDLIQCEVTGADNEADRIGLAELHYAAFHNGKLVESPATASGAQVWAIHPSDQVRGNYPVRAYLAVAPSGSALLAIFRGNNENAFNGAWETIAKSLSFPQPADRGGLIASGERNVTAMREAGLVNVITPAVRWSLWLQEDAMIGWSVESVSMNTADAWTGTKRYAFRDGPLVGRFIDSWKDNATMTSYTRTTMRDNENDDDETAVQKQFIRMMSSGKIQTETTLTSSLHTSFERVIPKNFIPGPWLALAMGKLKHEPMIVRTDCFPGFEPAQKGGLMTLLIEPSEEFPRPAEDGSGPLRCLTVKVNGSGEISRWYFTADNSLYRADFINGIHRKPSDEKYINYVFGDDTSMRP